MSNIFLLIYTKDLSKALSTIKIYIQRESISFEIKHKLLFKIKDNRSQNLSFKANLDKVEELLTFCDKQE